MELRWFCCWCGMGMVMCFPIFGKLYNLLGSVGLCVVVTRRIVYLIRRMGSRFRQSFVKIVVLIVGSALGVFGGLVEVFGCWRCCWSCLPLQYSLYRFRGDLVGQAPSALLSLSSQFATWLHSYQDFIVPFSHTLCSPYPRRDIQTSPKH